MKKCIFLASILIANTIHAENLTEAEIDQIREQRIAEHKAKMAKIREENPEPKIVEIDPRCDKAMSSWAAKNTRGNAKNIAIHCMQHFYDDEEQKRTKEPITIKLPSKDGRVHSYTFENLKPTP
ncbi:MAG TPA: hypothetical protein EYG13_05240 [Dehalococcoidia bacterium]|nr:hypothetical protein [Dehalococcoidia bacterium]